MTISVVIPAHNAERFIRPTVESALAQTWKDLELIVVDDGSADATGRVVAGIPDPRIRLLTGPRRGVSAARNEGIRAARGDRIAFLDHDDLWAPDKLRRQAGMMDGDPRLGLVFTQARVDQGGGTREIFPRIEDPETFLERAHENLIHWNYIPMSSVLIRRDVLDALAGPFDTRYDLAEDWDLWLRIAARLEAGGIGFIGEPLVRYVIRPGRATERMGDLRLEDIAIFERQIRENPWVERSDPERVRSTRYRLHEQAGYWLLKEGRAREARRSLGAAWRLRPSSIKPLRYLLASFFRAAAPTSPRRLTQGGPCA